MNTSKIDQASLLIDSKCQLGEGVLWHPEEKVLYWVDISQGILYRFDPNSGEVINWPMGSMIGTVVPAAEGGLVVALEKGIYRFESSTGLIQLCDFPENSGSNKRFNDGKCDPSGRFWVGTMNMQALAYEGNLFCFDGSSIILKLSGLTISNGMAWSSDHRKFYFIDTADSAVVVFDFDNVTGNISNKRKVIDVPPEMGVPDGMTIDREDKLWIAHWGASCVARWDAECGKLLKMINVPAPCVTSCIFGGYDLKTLFISTARDGLTDEQLLEFPLSGSLFSSSQEVSGYEPYFFQKR